MRDSWREVGLDSVLDLSIGGVWGSDPDVEDQNVWIVRSTEFQNDGRLEPSTGVLRSLSTRQVESRQLRTGDILLEKSGGGPKQPVGRVALVDGLTQVTVCSNFIQMLRPKPELVNPRYLWLALWHRHSTGFTIVYQNQTTGIRNLRTRDYLASPILLPPLDEQLRIVDLINSFDDAIEAARAVASGAATALVRAIASVMAPSEGSSSSVLGDRRASGSGVTLGEIARLDLDPVQVNRERPYKIAGVLNAGKGLFARGESLGSSMAYRVLNRMHTDQLIMRKLTAWEGPITVVPRAFDGWFASSEFPTFTIDCDRAMPEYLRHLCRSPVLWGYMRDSSTGTVQRRKRVQPKGLLAIRVPLPPVDVQAQYVSVMSALEDLGNVATDEVAALERVRAGVLDGLLAGSHEIPASYDEVMAQ